LPANEAAGEFDKGFVDEYQALESNPQASVIVEPADWLLRSSPRVPEFSMLSANLKSTSRLSRLSTFYLYRSRMPAYCFSSAWITERGQVRSSSA